MILNEFLNTHLLTIINLSENAVLHIPTSHCNSYFYIRFFEKYKKQVKKTAKLSYTFF
jgi:hypothetical protein